MEAKDLAAQALRYNSGKRQWNLVDFKSLEPMVKVLEFGSIKYLPDNWKKGMPREQILNSAMRHLTAMLDGEEIDSESGLPHSAHVACNMMFLSYFEQGLGSEKAMANYGKAAKEQIVWFNEVHEALYNKYGGQDEVKEPPTVYNPLTLENAKKLYKDFKAVDYVLFKDGNLKEHKNEPLLQNYQSLMENGWIIAMTPKDYNYYFGDATT